MKIKQIDECTFSPIKKGNILNCVNYKFSVMRLDTERYISMIFYLVILVMCFVIHVSKFIDIEYNNKCAKYRESTNVSNANTDICF